MCISNWKIIHFVKTGAYSYKLIEWLHLWLLKIPSLCFYSSCSVQSQLGLFENSWTAARQAPLSSTISQSLLKFMSIELVMLSNHFILCHILLLLSSIFTIIKVFFNESALLIRWPKYWSFSFSISPFNEYSGLISFRVDILAVQGTLKSPLKHHKCEWWLPD